MEPSAGSRLAGPPFVSVIIPIYGDAACLHDCLNHLARQTYPRERFETLVIDNGCPGIEGPLARHPSVQCLREARPGSYAARNAGLRVARGEIIAFTDADCLPDPEWIERGVESLSRRESTGISAGSIQVTPGRSKVASPAAYFYDATFGHRTTVEQMSGGYGVTANLVARRVVIDAVGPFNADFLSGGDVEWGRRAAAMGYRTEYVETVRVRHTARTSIRTVLGRQLRLAGGNQMNRERRAPTRGRARMLRMILEIVDTEISYLRSSISALRAADGTRAERARVAPLVVLVHVLRAAERIRVHLGGRPRRA
jgi:glycosyltransferase involved in cell wall biosynthesis